MRRTTILCLLAACALAFAAADGAATEPATLVVDGDRVQCANADFTSIQAAVDAAQPGDLIRVCPDLYSESVVVDKPLTLQADPDAVEAIDCFQPSLGLLPTDQQAIVDPSGEGFSIAFKLEADDVELAGFVVQGASVGIDASDRFSGYRVHQNLIRLNTLFAVDFGSEGTRESRVDHNCIRDALPNAYGLVSELDDDSLWKPSDGPERDEWNARDLGNARIDHNLTFRNLIGLEAAGPGVRDLVNFDHNVSREEGLLGIGLGNATRSAIVENELTITSSTFAAILLTGATEGLEIRSNIVQGSGPMMPNGGFGVRFCPTCAIDFFPAPNRNTVVAENQVRDAGAGIVATSGALVDSEITGNTTSGNARIGINMGATGTTGNIVRGNTSDNNRLIGINVNVGATGNRFEQNSMHGNALLDARDLNPLVNGMLPNVWIGNDCLTDFPAGLLCGVG